MHFHAQPDTAVFVVGDHTLSTTLKWSGGEATIDLTGERVSEVLRRADRASFFANGESVDSSFVTGLPK